MRHYTIRRLIKGYKLKRSLSGMTLIGIPYHCRYNEVMVSFDKCKMLITRNTPLLHKEIFKDKYRPNRMYTLYYYEWMPNSFQKSLF